MSRMLKRKHGFLKQTKVSSAIGFKLFADHLVQSAKITFRTFRCDGASSNLKLFAYAAKDDTQSLLALDICIVRAGNLMESAIIATMGMSLLNDIYACILFLRMGCYCMRLL